MQREIDNLKVRQDNIENQVNSLTNSVQKVVIGIDNLVGSISEQSKQLAVFNTKYEHQEKANEEMKDSIKRVWMGLEKETSIRQETTNEVLENRSIMKLIKEANRKLTFFAFTVICFAAGVAYIVYKGG